MLKFFRLFNPSLYAFQNMEYSSPQSYLLGQFIMLHMWLQIEITAFQQINIHIIYRQQKHQHKNILQYEAKAMVQKLLKINSLC